MVKSHFKILLNWTAIIFLGVVTQQLQRRSKATDTDQLIQVREKSPKLDRRCLLPSTDSRWKKEKNTRKTQPNTRKGSRWPVGNWPKNKAARNHRKSPKQIKKGVGHVTLTHALGRAWEYMHRPTACVYQPCSTWSPKATKDSGI